GECQQDLLTIRLHHGGALLRSPYTRYVGGSLDYFDYVDGKCLSIDVLRQFVGECRPLCDRYKTKFYHKFNDDWDKGCRFVSKDSDVLGLLKFSKTGNEVEIYVQHGDLDDMLRAEAAAGEIRHGDLDDMGEIRMDSYGSVYLNPVDSGDDLGDSSCSDSEGSDVGFVDEEYDMADDDTLFDRNVDEDVDESGPLSHTDLFSNAIHGQLRDSDGDADLNYDSDGLWNDKESSDVEGEPSKLDCYPKFNPKTDSRQPKFAIGMLFSSREELKDAIDTYNIKDARDIKYAKNEKGRVRAVCKDASCKWFIYAKRLSGEVGLQIRKWHLEHTCIPVYDNKMLTSTWLGKHYVKKFRNAPNYKPTDFRKEIEEVSLREKQQFARLGSIYARFAKNKVTIAGLKRGTNVDQPVVDQPVQEEFMDAPFGTFSRPFIKASMQLEAKLTARDEMT
ncbi:hypothetical protein Leryth_021587, partial [Lithospermum erythrorhizon]